MGLSSAGIGSGLDVTGIVQQLMAAEQKPLTTLTTKQTAYQSKLTAYGTVSSGLSTFQTTLKKLSDPLKLQAVTTTPADATVLTAKGGTGAVPGGYAVEVTQLATAQKLATAGQASLQTVVGQGTVSFDFGTISGGSLTNGQYTGASFTGNGMGSKTVTIGEGQNTLAGIRDAINAAGLGISATIVNDGSSSPYRLSLSNSQTGEATSMKISVAGDAGLQSLLNHDPAQASGQALTQTVEAKNAKLMVDGIAVSKPTNVVSDVVPGVTLTLNKTNAGSPTTLTVARDTAAVNAAVKEFVDGYNKLSASLKTLSKYDEATKKGAVLNGDSAVRSIQTQLRGIVTGSLSGGASSLTRLSSIGVELQKDGTLNLNTTKLQTVIDTQFDQLPGLFSDTGRTTDSLVSFSSASAKTQVGSYAVNVTQMASQARLSGSAYSGSRTFDASNNQLQVTLDGTSATVTLNNGTYTASQLAAEVQGRINSLGTFKDLASAVTVSANASGQLSFLSNRYGGGSNISLSGSAASLLLGDSLTGTDVRSGTAGTSLLGTVNGATALTSGQTLTGAVGDAAEGLKITVAGGSTGARGNVQYTQGFAAQLDRLASSFLGENGLITSRTEGINSSLKKIDSDKIRLQDRLTKLQKQYQDQYTKLDVTMSSMNSTASTLTQQLAGLANNNS